jgi:nitrite reductase/ring-hydroxylating ferredoxin subunit
MNIEAPNRLFSDAKTKLNALSKHGSYFTARDVAGSDELAEKIRNLIFEWITVQHGNEALSSLRGVGLTKLHTLVPAEDIKDIRDFVLPKIREDLLRLAIAIGRDELGMSEEFFVDDYLILRINYPFEVARLASQKTENPGIGRTTPKSDSNATQTRKIDPVYNPKSYHKGLPPAAWAHGPHQDTWSGHSYDGINVWWAIEQVLPENSMVFYPDMFGQALHPNPSTLYLASGQAVSKPIPISLAAGEMVLFNPEMLHGTHLNVSDETRIAVSIRLNARAPKFAKSCFYARELWQSSEKIADGIYNHVIHFPRDENLSDKEAGPSKTISKIEIIKPQSIDDGFQFIGRNELADSQHRWIIERENGDFLLLRTSTGWKLLPNMCPHLGAQLADGFADDDKIYCPADAVAFDLKTGHSACKSISLSMIDVVEIGTGLRFQLPL